MKKKTAQKSVQESALKPTMMRVPVTGKGQLRVGNPGNKGGTGRPPNELRALAREAAGKALPNIERIAVNQDLSSRDGDSVGAFNALVKLGVPQQHEVGENPDAPMLTPEQRAERLKKILGG